MSTGPEQAAGPAPRSLPPSTGDPVADANTAWDWARDYITRRAWIQSATLQDVARAAGSLMGG